jgi:GNAT superfamily N-acetyltransferase
MLRAFSRFTHRSSERPPSPSNSSLRGLEEFAERIRTVRRDNPWLVAEDNGTITGYAYATAFRSRAAYSHSRETSVYVHPDHHRQGIGRALMLGVIHELAARPFCEDPCTPSVGHSLRSLSRHCSARRSASRPGRSMSFWSEVMGRRHLPTTHGAGQ